MIVIQETTVLGATKRAFLELLNHAGNTSDPAILREDSATITVTQPQATSLAFVIDKNKLSYRANYQHYFPRVDLSLIKAEEIDYTRLFLEDGGIRRIIELLHRHPDSRRNLLSSWDTAYLDPSVTG